MRVIFHLRGNIKVPWQPDPDKPFHFGAMVATIRASGHFLVDELYIPATEISYITLELNRTH